MANGRSWTGIGIGVGVAALGGGLLWYLTRSGKASASPFTTKPPDQFVQPTQSNDQPMGGPPPPPTKPGVLTLSMNGDAITIDGKRLSPDQVVETIKTTTIPVEVHLYLVDKVLWQSIKDRLGKATSDKLKTVGVVSVGGLVHSNGARGRGVYG